MVIDYANDYIDTLKWQLIIKYLEMVIRFGKITSLKHDNYHLECFLIIMLLIPISNEIDF